jgi:YHS domain-containing protein
MGRAAAPSESELRRDHVVGAGAGGGVVTVVAGTIGAADKEPAIGGFCPVAYVKMGKAVKGDARWSSEQDGQKFLFSAAPAKEMFDKAPDQYRIAYHGYCATGVAMGKKIASNPETFSVHKGATYLFSSAEAKAMFDKDPDGTIAKADTAWTSLR